MAVNRREFLIATLGLGALATGCGGEDLVSGDVTSGPSDGALPPAIDPLPGNPFADPAVARATRTGRMLEVAVEARVAEASGGGEPVMLLTYDGSFIAPTIRAQSGDLLRLQFRNALPATGETNVLGHLANVTNLHVHGMHVTPGTSVSGRAGDDVFVRVRPGGGVLDYEYDLALQPPGSMGLYHPHVHGTVAEQIWGGMIGAIDIADDVAALSEYETHLLVLKDLSLSGGAPTPYSLMEYVSGKEGALVTVNAQLNPVLALRPGQVQRWRIFNASTARFFRLSLEGHSLQVIGSDGGLLDRPYPVNEILVSPAERVDVLVKASLTAGAYRMLALPYDRGAMGMMGGGMMGGGMGRGATSTVTLLTASVTGAPVSDPLPAVVNDGARRLGIEPATLPRARFVLGMHMARGAINGVSFDEMPDGAVTAYQHASRVGTYEVWEIVNRTGMDHPWHQHINSAQVLSASGGDAAFAAYAALYARAPAYKDTVIVPKWGSVTLLVPVLDYSGRTVFHCHIVEHEDIGMMGVWTIT
jgi:FtsP/CotA-like multicopper oxidase with cupredoxin domain